MKGTPYLNPDPFCHFIGPKNWGEALIDDKLTTCLLDNGSQLNFVTPTYAHERGMDILSLDTLAQEIGGQLPPIAVMGGGMIKKEGFVIMNVRVPCVRRYNEDQIAIVLEDPEMKDCPVVLGTPTLFRVMEVIKESEISELTVPWANSRLSWLMRGVHAKMSRLQVKDVANKPSAPLSVDEVVTVTSKCMVLPFGHKVIHSRVGLVLQGYKMNVMTHGLEKRSPLLPLGLEVQSAYATLATGSSRVPVVLRNNTKDWLEIKKGTPIARMVAANLIPRVINAVSAKGPDPASTLTEVERQDLLLDKLDLSGLDEWPTEQAEKARGLLKEYHYIFFLEKQDMGHTKAAEHRISVDEVVRVTSKCMVLPFGHKVIHGRVGLILQGYKMNVMTHGLEKRSPLLPLGLEVQSAYATLATGSSRVPVVSLRTRIPLHSRSGSAGFLLHNWTR